MYEGYLFSSTVDFLATSEFDMIYTWTLLVIGYIVPNLLILLSHLSIILVYRNHRRYIDKALMPGCQGALEPRRNHVKNQRLEVALSLVDIVQTLFISIKFVIMAVGFSNTLYD